MKGLFEALRFLTIIPVPGGGDCNETILHRAASYFPLVGLIIGGMMAGLAFGLSHLFSDILVSALMVFFMIAISGGFHIDGLADTADGFLSSRPPEKIMEIMKDSRVGAMGVIAIVMVCALKIVALSECPLWRAAFLAPVAGRCIMLLVMYFSKPADPKSGLGRIFLHDRTIIEVIFAFTVVVAASYILLGYAGLIALGVAVIGVIVLSVISKRIIGGATGDTIGASCEISELLIIMTLASTPVCQLGLKGAIL